MANTISVLNPANWKPTVQDFLNNILIATEIANTQFRAELVDGDTINFPQMSDLTVQDYAQGTDLTITALNATQSQLLINQSKAVTFAIDPVQERQAKAKYGVVMAQQAAFRLANEIDKQMIASGVAAANSSVYSTTQTLTSSTIVSCFNDAYASLFRNNATDAEVFAIVDAERRSLLTQTFVANGFVQADEKLANQFVGKAAGFKVYVTNNLPTTVTLTMPTIPTAGGTFTIKGVTFTWVAAGAAATAGDVSIGANVAASKVNLLLAIAGTATGSAATYIDLSVDNRNILKNNNVAASAFAGDVTTITAYGKIGATEAVAEADFVFGTGTTTILFGRMGAISLGLQMQPNLIVAQEPRQLARNYITHTLFGTKVFSRDAYRLVKQAITV